MQNPAAKTSSHYLINHKGEIYQLVKDEDTAWHAGIVNQPDWSLYDGSNPNAYTIGIEYEGFDGTQSEAQYQAGVWLQRELISKHQVPVNEERIIGHYRIDAVNRMNCPGPNFPWEKLFADLSTKVTIKQEKAKNARYDSLSEVPEWGKATVEKLIAKGALIGPAEETFDLSHDMLRILVINDRMGIYS